METCNHDDATGESGRRDPSRELLTMPAFNPDALTWESDSGEPPRELLTTPAYNYDDLTGEFICEELCQESPLEPGKFLVPANATLIPPPEAIEHTARCFRNGEWIHVPDYRGETIYDMSDSRKKHTVDAPGELPAGFTLTPPPDTGKHCTFDGETWSEYVPPRTTADYDQAMESHLRAEREARGYTSREPSDYKDSAVSRWAQDAADWIAHRDAVMLYALEIMNTYAETGEAPTIEEFKAGLPVITWTFEDER